MFTGIVEITRNASKAARSLVSVQSRMIQILDEQSSVGAGLREEYGKLGIALKDADGQLRSTYDILKDLGRMWGSLDSNTQKVIANLQAGGLRPFKVNCGNTLRDSCTKLNWGQFNGMANHYGIVKSTNIGQSATKHPERMKAQRLFFS